MKAILNKISLSDAEISTFSPSGRGGGSAASGRCTGMCMGASDPGLWGFGLHVVPLMANKALASQRSSSLTRLMVRARTTPSEVPTNTSNVLGAAPRKIPNLHCLSQRFVLRIWYRILPEFDDGPGAPCAHDALHGCPAVAAHFIPRVQHSPVRDYPRKHRMAVRDLPPDAVLQREAQGAKHLFDRAHRSFCASVALGLVFDRVFDDRGVASRLLDFVLE